MSDGDSLVLRRSRRSTAGNRMEAALAEMAALHLEQEAEADDDKDFLAPADEEEIFDSDFQSTDEDADQDEGVMAERQIDEEERQAQKSARRRTLRIAEDRYAAMRLASRMSSTVEAYPSRGTRQKTEKRHRRALRDRSPASEGAMVAVKRKSQRKSTVLSSQILHLRLKDAEERRAALPKRLKETSTSYTQAELLARALDNEEGNITSHRNYLEEEEEKRKRARVIKRSLAGPVLSWVSRIEEESVSMEPSASDLSPPAVCASSLHSLQPSVGAENASTLKDSTSYSVRQPYGSAPLPSSYFASSAALQALSQPPGNVRSPKVDRVAKNYLLHKVDEGSPRPGWNETMNAVFGEHANWNEVRVYTGKHRPLARPVRKCPITGQTAIYHDPRTGIPFAGVDAYKVLSRLLRHDFVWDDALRCYTADEKAVQIEAEINDSMESGLLTNTSI